MTKIRSIWFLFALSVGLAAHAETATYTVTSYHTIALTAGTAPDGSTATFNSTTARGSQITAGNSATLTLTGYDELFISALTVQMHSNKTSGGGSLRAYLNGTMIASIADASFADSSWNGTYATADEWADINVPLTGFTFPQNAELTVVIEASANSLYVGGFTVSYNAGVGQNRPKIVVLMTGTEETLAPLRESSAGRGVRLPNLQDADSVWHFLGWTEAEWPHSEECPTFFRAGTTYFPTKNTTLYALYTNKLALETLVQDTLFETGTYAIVTALTFNCMMAGGVTDRRVGSTAAELFVDDDSLYHLNMETIPPENCYQVTFTDTTAIIRHQETNSGVGYTSQNLATNTNEWSVTRALHHSLCLYHHVGMNTYCLFPTTVEGQWAYKSVRLNVREDQLFLLFFAVPDEAPEPALYTTMPRSGLGVQSPTEETQYRVYRLDGTCLFSCATDQELRALPAGIYIITSPHGTQKRIVRTH